jgi:para-nitrobenzyl esterase
MSRRRLTLSFIAVSCIAIVPLLPRDAASQSAACLVATTRGQIQGVDSGGSCTFLGIPYAAPPTGNLRWGRPQPPAPWAPALLSATTPSANCPGFNPTTGLPQGNEDCLRLNVWTPAPAPTGRAPVIVWLHTGAFVGASANFAGANGRRFAEETGAVIVAPNYRHGPFGFLAHAALTSEDVSYRSSGNYGLLDQRAALAWARENIAAFGGDSTSITIAGTSAGGLSASLHLVSPGSAGFFERAIVQSGTASYRWRGRDEAHAQGNRFADALGCTDPSQVLICLRGKSRDEILAALPLGTDQVLEGSRVQWGPVVDGVEVPGQPRLLLETGAFHRVPVVVGTNRDEGWMFVDRSFRTGLSAEQYSALLATEFGADAAAVEAAYPAAGFSSPKEALAKLVGDVEYVCEARRVARLLERSGMPVYKYSFEYEVDAVAQDRVIHGLESNLLFGNNFGPPTNYVLSGPDLALFRSMSGYWARFAASGNPNVDDDSIVHWPAVKHPTGPGRGPDKHLVLGSTIREGQRLSEAACDFWEPFFLRSVTGAVPAAAP